MNRSPIAVGALSGRGDNGESFLPKDYRLQLPALPTGEAWKLSVVLHADLEARPYRIEDFRAPSQQAGVLPEVAGLGAYHMSRVWLIKLRMYTEREGEATGGRQHSNKGQDVPLG